MKNRGFLNLSISLILIILLVILYYFAYKKNDIDETIKNVKWYRYDNKTGYYESLLIKDDSFLYTTPGNEEYKDCSSYTYDKKNNRILLNCEKRIDIVKAETKELVLDINKEEKHFFLNIDDSLNNEFKIFFNKSISEYKKDKKQVLDYIKINNLKLEELLKEEKYTFVLFSDKCTAIECTLILNYLEKNVVKNSDLYYIDSSFIDEKTKNLIKKEINDENIILDDIYPVIINKSKNKINNYKFVCSGFDCNKYN